MVIEYLKKSKVTLKSHIITELEVVFNAKDITDLKVLQNQLKFIKGRCNGKEMKIKLLSQILQSEFPLPIY